VWMPAWDLAMLGAETLLLSTDLSGGATSFGQDPADAAGLRLALGKFEVSRRAHKALLSNLDAPSRCPGNLHLEDSEEGLCSLRYRLSLLRNLRARRTIQPPGQENKAANKTAVFEPFSLLGHDVDFDAWRAAQLRL
ncbi:hypothetical protein T484DRAFT_1942742, partial [Baffinella frigidus]